MGFKSLNGFNKCTHLPIRLRKEQLRKQLAQEQRQQEAKAQQVKQNGKNEEDLHKLKQEEDKQKKEEQVLQTQMNKEVRVLYNVPGSCFCPVVISSGFRFLVNFL